MKKFLLSIIIFNVLVIVSSSSSLALNQKNTLYPINKNGQTYGADIYSNTNGEEPDLIAAYGTDGKLGYIKAIDLESNIKTPEEAIKQQRNKKSPKIIPVYDKDGTTIISQFILHVNSNQSISKEEVITWINEQSKNKLEYYDDFVYKSIDLDNDSQLEVVAKNIGGVHLGTFYIFDCDESGKYKLIAEENWHISSWDFSNPIIIDNKKIYEVVNRSGGTGIDVYTANLWYVENGKFIKAWDGLLKSRSVFKYDYSLKMGNYKFNDENNLMYTWLSNYIYKLDGITLKEKGRDDIKVFKFDGTKFSLTPQTE